MKEEYFERIDNIVTKINELPEDSKSYLLDIIEGLLNIKEVES